jgi:hypothetical protein
LDAENGGFIGVKTPKKGLDAAQTSTPFGRPNARHECTHSSATGPSQRVDSAHHLADSSSEPGVLGITQPKGPGQADRDDDQCWSRRKWSEVARGCVSGRCARLHQRRVAQSRTAWSADGAPPHREQGPWCGANRPEKVDRPVDRCAKFRLIRTWASSRPGFHAGRERKDLTTPLP